MRVCNTWAPKWRRGLRHCISVQEMSLQSLIHIQGEAHLTVIGSPIAQRQIRPGYAVTVNVFLIDLLVK